MNKRMNYKRNGLNEHALNAGGTVVALKAHNDYGRMALGHGWFTNSLMPQRGKRWRQVSRIELRNRPWEAKWLGVIE